MFLQIPPTSLVEINDGYGSRQFPQSIATPEKVL